MRRFASALPLFALSCSAIADTGEAASPSGAPGGGATPDVTSPPLPPATALRPIAPTFDPRSTSKTIDAWPRITPGVFSRATTSFDRSGGNDDGFNGTYSELYVDRRGEHVVFDESGPGVLRTLWFTSDVSGDAPLDLGLVRFYFDGEDKARIAIDANALFTGSAGGPFVLPLVAGNQTTSGGFASWAPLPFRQRLRITIEKRAQFYQAHHDVLPADWDVESYTPNTVDDVLVARFDAALEPSSLQLDDVALDVTRTGAGIIDVLRFAPDATPTDAELDAARIRIWFDGAADPQVDLPLGFFFGSARGLAPIRSLVWTMRPTLFESRLPMPYWEGVHVTVTGLAGKLSLHTREQAWLREETGTLEARLDQETPTTSGKDFVYADVTGAGKLVATVLGVDPVSAGNKQWWEGDLRTRVDGLRTPDIHGTGHEDDHLGGWSNEFLSRPFSLPMQGCPRTDLFDTGAELQKNGRTTMYRLWPGIPFYRSIRHSTEHGTGNGRDANYAAATFLYRQSRERTVISDSFDVADEAAAAAHQYDAPGRTEWEVVSAFEGESAEALTATIHEYTSPIRFTLSIDPNNEGVVLRRRFDRSEAPLQSVIDVDDVRVRVERNASPVAKDRKWAERDTFVPSQVTHGKSRITVRWVPDTSAKPDTSSERRTNAARFEAWSVLPAKP